MKQACANPTELEKCCKTNVWLFAYFSYKNWLRYRQEKALQQLPTYSKLGKLPAARRPEDMTLDNILVDGDVLLVVRSRLGFACVRSSLILVSTRLVRGGPTNTPGTWVQHFSLRKCIFQCGEESGEHYFFRMRTLSGTNRSAGVIRRKQRKQKIIAKMHSSRGGLPRARPADEL